MKTKEIQNRKIKEVFSLYRGLILDALEQELFDYKNWSYLRARMLKLISSDRGLEFKINEVLEDKNV